MLARPEFQTAILFRAPFWLAAISAGTLLGFKPAAAEEKGSLPPILSIAAAAARTHNFSEFLAAVREAEQEKQELIATSPSPLAKALAAHVTVREYRFGKSTIRQMIVGPNDPHFAQWQSQADARLKAENGDSAGAVSDAPENAGIGAGGSTAVICEGGCTHASGTTVYSAADHAAAEPGEQHAATQPTANSIETASPSATLNGAFECLAGCYAETPAPATAKQLAGGTARGTLAKVAAAKRASTPLATASASATPAAGALPRIAQNAAQDSIESHLLHLPPRTASVTRP